MNILKELLMNDSTPCKAASEVLWNALAWAEEAAEAGGDGSSGVRRASGGVPTRMLHSRK